MTHMEEAGFYTEHDREVTEGEAHLDDLMDAIEDGTATAEQINEARDLAELCDEDDLLHVDPFNGDAEQTAILKDKMVAGRKPYVDHWTGMPIAAGERHRCIVERGEDGDLITTRHSRLSLWILSQGFDPSGLRPTGEGASA